MKPKKSLAESLSDALISIRRLPPRIATKQSHFGLAKEFSGIQQCIELGILDANGNNTERTQSLIYAYHNQL